MMGLAHYYGGDYFVDDEGRYFKQERKVNYMRLAEVTSTHLLDLLDIALGREDYESCAILRDEAKRRGVMPDPT